MGKTASTKQTKEPKGTSTSKGVPVAERSPASHSSKDSRPNGTTPATKPQSAARTSSPSKRTQPPSRSGGKARESVPRPGQKRPGQQRAGQQRATTSTRSKRSLLPEPETSRVIDLTEPEPEAKDAAGSTARILADANADYGLPLEQKTSDDTESGQDTADEAAAKPATKDDEPKRDEPTTVEPTMAGPATVTAISEAVELELEEPTRAERPGWFARHVVSIAVLMSGLVMAGAGAFGYWFAEEQPDVWQAEAEIVLQTPANQIDRYLGTQVVMAMSSSVVDRAAAVVPISREDIDDELGVEPIDAGVAIRVSFDSEDSDLAVDVVDAVVSAYLTETETESTSTTRAVYSSRIEELRSARAVIEAELAVVESANAEAEALELAPPNPTEERRLSLESTQLLEQISGLESQLLVTDIELLNQDQAVVVTPAQLLPDRVAPSPFTFAALGILAGGVVAATIVFLLGLFRSSRARKA